MRVSLLVNRPLKETLQGRPRKAFAKETLYHKTAMVWQFDERCIIKIQKPATMFLLRFDEGLRCLAAVTIKSALLPKGDGILFC